MPTPEDLLPRPKEVWGYILQYEEEGTEFDAWTLRIVRGRESHVWDATSDIEPGDLKAAKEWATGRITELPDQTVLGWEPCDFHPACDDEPMSWLAEIEESKEN